MRERDLRAELEAGAVRGSARVRAALREVATGAWSQPELELLGELAASTVLPRVWPNPVLAGWDGMRLPSPDAWIDEVQLALQVHSRRHHARDADWESTVEADTIFGEYGVLVLGVTPTGFRRSPARYRERVERAYLALRSAPRPRLVTMTPRGAGVLH